MAPIPNPPEAAKQTPVQPKGATKPVAPRASLAHPSGQAGTDPAKAAKLRTAGLVQLNRGMVDKAVALLQQALALDPSSELIQHDLDRAVRIRQAVQAKP
jgi:Tfp pilus assembly protein PilF